MKIIQKMITLLLCVLLCMAGGFPSARAEEEPVSVDNGIPVIILHIDESQGTIEDMISSPDHSVYCYGTLSIDVPEGFHYSDFPDLPCESMQNLSMSIRGRGNTTWSASKKPFKIKLDSKKDLFGLGKNKHWALIANAYDRSMLKDRITAWLGDAMDFAFTPRGVPVDVIMTGETYGTRYLGSYYLTENVRVGENRLEIEELTETDTDPSVITGGYLLQDAAQVREGSPDRFITSRGVDWATETPSFDTDASLFASRDHEERDEEADGTMLKDAYANPYQQEYIQNHMQYVEDVLFEEGTAYRDLIDLESSAKYWLVNTFAMNTDAYATGSTYIYKDRDPADGISKLYWGPLWDFDYAWDFQTYTSGMSAGHEWLLPMFHDREAGGFVEEVHKQWTLMRDHIAELIKDGGVIDGYYEETKASAAYDAKMLHDDDAFDYYALKEHLKDWIRRRLAWMDENFDLVDTLVHKVTYMVNEEVIASEFIQHNEMSETLGTLRPEVEGYTFMGWYDEEDNPIDSETRITDDLILHAKLLDDSEITHGEDIALSKDSDIVRYNSHVFRYQIPYTVIPEDAVDRQVTWTSSDESYSTVDENGIVSYSGPGTVVLTGKLKNGKTRTFTLTVTEEDLPVPAAITPETDTVTLKPGQQGTFMIHTDPSPASISGFTYTSDDPNVVTVGENGVLTALSPGTVVVHVETVSYDADGNEIILRADMTVIVEEETPAPQPSIISYHVTMSSGTTWRKGTKNGYILTVKRSEEDETCFSHFTGVKLDDVLLQRDRDYTAAKGSTIVTIMPEVMDALDTGTHKIEFLFDDGSVTAETEVLPAKDRKPKPSPDTGDSFPVWTMGILSMSLLMIVLASKALHSKQ